MRCLEIIYRAKAITFHLRGSEVMKAVCIFFGEQLQSSLCSSFYSFVFCGSYFSTMKRATFKPENLS